MPSITSEIVGIFPPFLPFYLTWPDLTWPDLTWLDLTSPKLDLMWPFWFDRHQTALKTLTKSYKWVPLLAWPWQGSLTLNDLEHLWDDLGQLSDTVWIGAEPVIPWKCRKQTSSIPKIITPQDNFGSPDLTWPDIDLKFSGLVDNKWGIHICNGFCAQLNNLKTAIIKSTYKCWPWTWPWPWPEVNFFYVGI